MILSPTLILLTCLGLFCAAVMLACCWQGAAPLPPPDVRKRRVETGAFAFKILLAVCGLALIGAYTVFWSERDPCVKIGGTWVQGGRC